MSKKAVECFNKHATTSIVVTIDKDEIYTTQFHVRGLRDAIATKVKFDGDPSTIKIFGCTPAKTPPECGAELPEGELPAGPFCFETPCVSRDALTVVQKKRGRPVIHLAVSADHIFLRDVAYNKDDVGVIVRVAEKGTERMTLLEVCKSLKDGVEVTMYDGELCTVKKATDEPIQVSAVDSQPTWLKLQCGSIDAVFHDSKIECASIELERFTWNTSKEDSKEQVSACHTHLRALLNLPSEFDVYRNTEKLTVHLESGVVLCGTIAGDFFIRYKKDDSLTCVTCVLELKKEVASGDKYQAGAELVGMETQLARPVPVFLTDLRDDWRLLFRDAIGIRCLMLSRDEAVHMIQGFTAKFVIPRVGIRAGFSEAPIRGFLLELPKSKIKIENEERLQDELSVMQMSGCTYPEIRDFIFSRVTFGGIAVNESEGWRNMFV